jgi:ActR/RegA family two-component response regulator
MSEEGVMTGWHVLVIEDETLLQESLVRALRSRGARAEGASSLVEQRAMLRKKRWDAVLLDMRLDADDGFELVPEVRALQPDAALVTVSGYLGARRMVELQETCVAHVPKPCSIDVLTRLMYFERGRVVGEESEARRPTQASRARKAEARRRQAFRWVEQVRALLDESDMAREGGERAAALQTILPLLLDRTLEGRGASWRDLAGALGRAAESQASDVFVRKRIGWTRRWLRSAGLAVSLRATRERGYFLCAEDDP